MVELRRAQLLVHVIMNAYEERLDFELPAVGGGGAMVEPPLLQAAIQRAAATSALRRRFIAHLAELPFALASR